MNPTRIRDMLYSMVSISLGIVFFYLAFDGSTGFGAATFSTFIWETAILGLLGAFLLGGSIYGFAKTFRSRQQDERNPVEDKIWRDIMVMLILIGVFLAAVWAMFHFGLG